MTNSTKARRVRYLSYNAKDWTITTTTRNARRNGGGSCGLPRKPLAVKATDSYSGRII